MAKILRRCLSKVLRENRPFFIAENGRVFLKSGDGHDREICMTVGTVTLIQHKASSRCIIQDENNLMFYSGGQLVIATEKNRPLGFIGKNMFFMNVSLGTVWSEDAQGEIRSFTQDPDFLRGLNYSLSGINHPYNKQIIVSRYAGKFFGDSLAIKRNNKCISMTILEEPKFRSLLGEASGNCHLLLVGEPWYDPVIENLRGGIL